MVYREVKGLSISVVRGAAGRESAGLYVVRIKGKKVAEYGLPLPGGSKKWIVTWGPYEGLLSRTQATLEDLIVMNYKSDMAAQAVKSGGTS